jgi:predicted outer membrane repeat protein
LYVIEIDSSVTDFYLTKNIVFPEGTNVLLQSATPTPRVITRTTNAGRFTYSSVTTTPKSIILSNIIIDGGGDGASTGIVGTLFNLNNYVHLYMGKNGTSAEIRHCDSTGAGLTLIMNNYSKLIMQGDSSIHDFNMYATDAGNGEFALLINFSELIMNDNSSIHDNTSSWNTPGSSNRPILVDLQSRSRMLMTGNSRMYSISAYWGVYIEGNGYFGIDGNATITNCEILSAIISARDQPSISYDNIEIMGGRIYNNTNNNIISLYGNAVAVMSGGSIDHNYGGIGITLTKNSIFNMSGGSISYNTSTSTARGGIISTSPSQATETQVKITGGKFIGNKCYKGGVIGIEPSGTDPGNRLTVSGASKWNRPEFIDNTAETDGGAIFVADYSRLTLGPNVLFSGNKASKYFDGGVDLGNTNNSGMSFTKPFHFAYSNADVNYDPSDPTNHIVPFVKFDTQGGGDDPPEQIIDPSGDLLVEQPPSPHRYNKVFTGWYTEPQGGIKWDFSTMPVASGMVTRASQYGVYLYAHWRNLNAKELCKRRWTKGAWHP